MLISSKLVKTNERKSIGKRCFSKAAFAVAMLFMVSACSLEANLTNLSEKTKDMFDFKAQPAEIVSGSSQLVVSKTRHYQIQATTGALVSPPYKNSNLRGYRLYQGIQGQMISE